MSNDLYLAKQRISFELALIPKKNKSKFQQDYLKLIKLAQRKDYDSFKITQN